MWPPRLSIARAISDAFAPPRLLRQVREHVPQVRVGVADPFPIRRDPEQLLGHDQAQQLDVVQRRQSARLTIPRKAESGQDSVVEMNVKRGQEGVEVSFHTQGLTGSAND